MRVLPSSSGHPLGDQLAVGSLDDDADVGDAFADLLAVLDELVLDPATERLIGVRRPGRRRSRSRPSRNPIGTASSGDQAAAPECAARRSPHCHVAGRVRRRARCVQQIGAWPDWGRGLARPTLADSSDWPTDAGADDVRAARRRLAKRCHPDVDGGDAEAMRRLNEAAELVLRASSARQPTSSDAGSTAAARPAPRRPPTGAVSTTTSRRS